eukprot:scaffold1054_cov366-Prasinococcus_capsulatus_cf.AAC.8
MCARAAPCTCTAVVRPNDWRHDGDGDDDLAGGERRSPAHHHQHDGDARIQLPKLLILSYLVRDIRNFGGIRQWDTCTAREGAASSPYCTLHLTVSLAGPICLRYAGVRGEAWHQDWQQLAKRVTHGNDGLGVQQLSTHVGRLFARRKMRTEHLRATASGEAVNAGAGGKRILQRCLEEKRSCGSTKM